MVPTVTFILLSALTLEKKRTPPDDFSDGVLPVAAQREAGIRREQKLQCVTVRLKSRSGDRLPVPGWTGYRN